MRGQLANTTPQDPGHAQHPDRRSNDQQELQEALASFGLLAPETQGGDDAGAEIWLWPENRPAWDLWLCLQTQWRVGMGGATGLDYAGVQAAMQLMGIARRERGELFALVRAMEGAALDEWERRRK